MIDRLCQWVVGRLLGAVRRAGDLWLDAEFALVMPRAHPVLRQPMPVAAPAYGHATAPNRPAVGPRGDVG